LVPSKSFDFKKYSNILVFSITLIPLVLFLFIVWNRITLPFIFEWGESAGVNQINRILSGSRLYGQPSLEFAPLVYTPLYYYLAAGLSKLMNNPLLAGRLISLLSTIGSTGIIGVLIFRETKQALLAWVSAMAFLACFSLSGGFFDLVRVDALFVFSVLITFSVFRNAKTFLEFIFIGLLLAAGFYIKQTFLIVFFPLSVYLVVKHWKLSISTIIGGAAALAFSLILVNLKTESWFFYYIFELPRQHGYSPISAIDFWIGDTLRPLGIMVAASLVFLFSNQVIPRIRPEKQVTSVRKETEGLLMSLNGKLELYGLFLLGAAAAAWITRSSNGGGANNVLVFYAALALTFGLGLDQILETTWIQDRPVNYAFFLVLISVQFVGMVYNPFRFLPTQDEIRLNTELELVIRESGRSVLVPYRSHLAEELLLKPQIHIVNLFELTGYFKGDIQPAGYELVGQIRENICQQAYGLIVFDQPLPWFQDQVDDAYLLDPGQIAAADQTSELLAWQGGAENRYIPRDKYTSDECLGNISQAGD